MIELVIIAGSIFVSARFVYLIVLANQRLNYHTMLGKSMISMSAAMNKWHPANRIKGFYENHYSSVDG